MGLKAMDLLHRAAVVGLAGEETRRHAPAHAL